MKHTNTIEESEVYSCVFSQFTCTENNMAVEYTGMFEVSIRWIQSHGRAQSSEWQEWRHLRLLCPKYGLARAIKFSRERTNQW